jgi:hypothetical protein
MPRRPEGPAGPPPRRKPHTPPAAPAHGAGRRPRPDVDVSPPAPAPRAGFGGLLRGPGSVLGGLTAVDGASRSLDRLSRAADRGASFLERMETELGWDRAIQLVDRLETLVALLEGRGLVAERLHRLVNAVEGIGASLEEIEAMMADLHEEYMPARPAKAKPASRPRR